jgi:anti-anti-sigma regulatory factor
MTMNAFRLMTVVKVADELRATIASVVLSDSEDLQRDFLLLKSFRAGVVRLDLQAVGHLDGRFLGALLVLNKELRANGTHLVVAASPEIAEIMRFTKLNKMIDVAGEGA